MKFTIALYTTVVKLSSSSPALVESAVHLPIFGTRSCRELSKECRATPLLVCNRPHEPTPSSIPLTILWTLTWIEAYYSSSKAERPLTQTSSASSLISASPAFLATPSLAPNPQTHWTEL